MKKTYLLAAAALMATSAFAQKGVEDGSKFGHGEDSVRCVMNLVQYQDNVKLKQYKEAYEPWKVVFDEAPLAKKTTLYTDGVKITKALYQKTKDEQYFNVLMSVYDQRMKYFGTDKNYPTSYLKGMKALDILSFKNGAEDLKTAVQLFNESFEGDAKVVDPAFLVKYMEATVKLFQSKEVDAETVVNNYINAGNTVTKMQNCGKTFTGKTDQEKADKKAKYEENLATSKDNLDQIFAQSGAADIETLNSVFGPQLDANKENTDWLKKVNRFLSKAEGGDESDLFFATSEYLHKIEPAASSARGLARMSLKKQDSESAVSYYQQAIELETDDMDKAKYYYELSGVFFSLSKFGEAKSAAYSAAKLRDNWGDPYILLGKIYATGARNIGTEDWEKKAGYWAAVDKFVKAKNVDPSERIQKDAAQLISQYSQYFPTREDLFMHGMQDGSSYTVGGFIGESTTIRSKK